MKLSDAIILGSTMTKLDSSCFLAGGEGCLLGMGMSSFGYKTCELAEISNRFPWTDNKFICPDFVRVYKSEKVTSLYDHLGGWEHIREFRAQSIIGRMAVMVEEGAITLDKAVDWIRSVEPQEVMEPESADNIETTLELIKLP